MFPLLLALLIVAEGTAADDWWTTASLYEIYTPSFKDSDGDGTGDIIGIMSQVDYLSELKVDAVWLTAFYESPFQDGGYDITDFQNVNPRFGTLNDVSAMIDAFHKKGIKVLLDFVPNHTSDQHSWFKDSVEKKNGKDDFYVWRNMSTFQVQPIAPTNWKSLFMNGTDSAWTFNPSRQQFYLHQFGKFQPDLNYHNREVVDAMKDVLRFWLSKGVDGFRVDAAPFLVEEDIENEPMKEDCKEDNYRCYQHIYTMNQNLTYTFIKEFESVLEEASKNGSEKVLFVAGYTDIDNTMKYYGKRTIPFNYFLINDLEKASNAYQFSQVINNWMVHVPHNYSANWVIGSHDVQRVGSRFDKHMINLMNMLVLLLPGVSVTYYGEEIGMMNTEILANHNDTNYFVSRDGERTPFQWNDGPNAGFSNATNTWLPVNPNYYEINVNLEKNSSDSVLNVYKMIKEFRNSEMLMKDWRGALNISDYVLAMRRGDMFVILNLDNQPNNVSLASLKLTSDTIGQLRLSTNPKQQNRPDLIDFSKSLLLMPGEGIVVQVPSRGESTLFASFTLLIVCLIVSLRS